MAPALFTREEVQGRKGRGDCVIIIDNVVYDVTAWLDDHPGGIEVLLDNGGQDASRCFHAVGHSDDAKEWRRRYIIGEVVPEERWEVRAPPRLESSASADELSLGGLLRVWAPPLLFSGIAILVYVFLLS